MRKEKRNRVLILGCGGTIVCLPGPDGALMPAKTVDDIAKVIPSLTERVDVELKQIENRDSSELTPSHWTKFAMAIAEAVSSGKYIGIIGTHGTDTMAYTTTAIGLVLGRSLTIPVIFTGSQRSLFKARTDARFNVENSMEVLLQAAGKRIAEVMIVFNKFVLRGTRAVKISESDFDAFGSPAFPPLAIISALEEIRFNPGVKRVPKNAQWKGEDLDFHFQRGVVVFDLVPGLEPGIVLDVLHGGKCQAIVLRSLGAGNVPSMDEYSLMPCIKEANRLKIPVVVTTKFVGGTTHAGMYGPGKAALDAGAIESGNLTDVAVQVKLMWLLAKGKRSREEIQRALLMPVAGEVG